MIIDLEYITCQITTLEGINMTKIKTLKIAVAFGLAILLGVSLFTPTDFTSTNSKFSQNRYVQYLLGHPSYKAGGLP